jgi:protein-disulfide isomerase
VIGRPRSRLAAATILGVALWAGLACAASPREGEMALGNSRAPVTVVEYGSVGCPHCGVWAREVFPAFKKKYVDTGKVRFVLREMLTGDPTLAAVGFLMARCAGPARYFDVVEAIFEAQPQMELDGRALPSLLRIANQEGMNEAQFNACVSDPAALKALQARSDSYAEIDKITGTPTFVVGDKMLPGDQTLEALDAAIAAATPAHGKPR